jgi:hypothetical protein
MASSGMFARVIVELDATRRQAPVSEPVDAEFIEDVQRRMQFVTVKASQPSKACALSGDVNNSVL